MTRIPLRSPEEFFNAWREALSAWCTRGCDQGPELDALFGLTWDWFGAAVVAYLREHVGGRPAATVHDRGNDKTLVPLAESCLFGFLNDCRSVALRNYEGVHTAFWRRAATTVARVRTAKTPGDQRMTMLQRDEFWQQLRSEFSSTELTILQLVLDALTPEQIADCFGCEPSDVHVHLSSMRGKAEDLLDRLEAGS